jgi:RNA polymerase sigma-70 factor (ECF subfamily)
MPPGAADSNPWEGWSDEDLLLRYREEGDRRAFEELVGRYERELYNYLRHYLGDAEMAEDAFQAAFLQVHLKCDQFDAGRKVRPWLYTIATNQAIDARRRNRRHRMVSLDRKTGANGRDAEAGACWTAMSRVRMTGWNRPSGAGACGRPWSGCPTPSARC